MIECFTGHYRFLSNFFPAGIEYEGVVYPTVENAFQAAKTLDGKQRKRFILCPPALAKRRGRQLVLRPDWEEIKLGIMRQLLEVKFRKDGLFWPRLLDTSPHELVEGNWWGDTFWGVCDGKGENHLGKLLMEIRANV